MMLNRCSENYIETTSKEHVEIPSGKRRQKNFHFQPVCQRCSNANGHIGLTLNQRQNACRVGIWSWRHMTCPSSYHKHELKIFSHVEPKSTKILDQLCWYRKVILNMRQNVMLFQYITIYIDTTYLSDMETMSSKRLNLKVFLTFNIQCYFNFKTWHCFNIIIWTLVHRTFWRWTNVKRFGYRVVLTLTFFHNFILNIDPMLCFWCWTSVGNHVIYLFI